MFELGIQGGGDKVCSFSSSGNNCRFGTLWNIYTAPHTPLCPSVINVSVSTDERKKRSWKWIKTPTTLLTWVDESACILLSVSGPVWVWINTSLNSSLKSCFHPGAFGQVSVETGNSILIHPPQILLGVPPQTRLAHSIFSFSLVLIVARIY